MKRRILPLTLALTMLLSMALLSIPLMSVQASRAAAVATATRTRTATKSVTPSPTITRTDTATSIPVGPDLIVQSISLNFESGDTGSCRKVDSRVGIKATIKNIGTVDAGQFQLSGSLFNTITGLAAGQSIEVASSFGQYYLFYGTTGVTVNADAYAAVTETNETNNSLTAILPLTPLCTATPTPTVHPTLPDLVITSVVRSPAPGTAVSYGCYTSGITYGTYVAIQNIGGVDAGPFTVSVSSGSTTVTQQVSGLAAGATTSVWVNIYYIASPITVVVDSSNTVAEANEDNTKIIYVSSATGTPTGTPQATCTPNVSKTPSLTPTLTPTGPTPTFTKSPTISPTPSGDFCAPVTSTVTAPFSFDGAGVFCWQSSNLGSYINSWNTSTVTINGINITNMYLPSGSYPAKIGGFWYVSYYSSVTWGHLEAK